MSFFIRKQVRIKAQVLMKNSYTILILLLMLIGCKEIYYPEISENEENILIVQANLYASHYTVSVVLNYASNNNINENLTPVCCAEISVTDQDGNITYLSNDSGGIYTASLNAMNLNPGESYKLHIQLEDGTLYESSEEKVPELPSEIKITHQNEIEQVLIPISSGNYISKESKGIKLKVDVTGTDQTPFYSFLKTTYITENYHTVIFPDGSIMKEACWTINNRQSIPKIGKSLIHENLQKIKGMDADFMEYINNTLYKREYTDILTTTAWIFILNYYSTNKNAYDYYNNMISLLQANNSIFDPIPVSLTGNVFCISDPGAKVTGFFEVSKDTTLYRAYNWRSSRTQSEEMPLESFEPPDLSGCYGNKPDFWIDANDISNYVHEHQ